MKVGDLVKSKSGINSMIMAELPRGLGIITKRVGKDIAYVFWGNGKPKPINIRLIKRI